MICLVDNVSCRQCVLYTMYLVDDVSCRRIVGADSSSDYLSVDDLSCRQSVLYTICLVQNVSCRRYVWKTNCWCRFVVRLLVGRQCVLYRMCLVDDISCRRIVGADPPSDYLTVDDLSWHRFFHVPNFEQMIGSINVIIWNHHPIRRVIIFELRHYRSGYKAGSGVTSEP
jgi:hypothetical protein